MLNVNGLRQKAQLEQARFVKYGNRRLFDRRMQHYVTVADIVPDLINGAQVCRHPDGVDVTAMELVNVIRAHVKDGQHVKLIPAALRAFIRSYAELTDQDLT